MLPRARLLILVRLFCFAGVDIRTNERIAIKVENRSTKYPQLMEEYQGQKRGCKQMRLRRRMTCAAIDSSLLLCCVSAVYRAVAKGVGVPAAIWCGSNSNVHIMVMELLGDSLETLYNNCGRKFSLKTITMLAIQLLHRIEHHHNHHYLHRDIKPDNFLMGPPQSHNAHILYMVDMGLCKVSRANNSSQPSLPPRRFSRVSLLVCLLAVKKYRDETNLHHIPYRENKKLIGTPRYASINVREHAQLHSRRCSADLQFAHVSIAVVCTLDQTHLGIEQCRRDDLESIGYMLIYFFAGKLPWQGLKVRL